MSASSSAIARAERRQRRTQAAAVSNGSAGRADQFSKAGTDLLRIEQTALELDTREFGTDGLNGCELDPELAAEAEDRVLSLVQYHWSDIRVLPLGEEGFPQGQHATADPRPCLQDRNLVPGRLELVRGHET